METKHTALPWRIGNDAVVSDHPVGDRPLPDKTRAYYGGEVICETVTPSNAELIVRAVNSHAALLKLAQVVAKSGRGLLYPQWEEIQALARKALNPETTEG